MRIKTKATNFYTISFFLIAFASNAQVVMFKNVPYDESTKNLVLKELARYPKGLLRQYLDSVIVCDFQHCGRSHAYSKYFILDRNCNQKEKTVHHELSSVFLIRFDLYVSKDYGEKLIKQFYALNGNEVHYDTNAPRSEIPITNKAADYFYKRFYAQTNFENDFNVIAEYLFTEGRSVLEFIQNNPDKPIAKKIQLVLDFYRALDPSFTKEYFQQIAI